MAKARCKPVAALLPTEGWVTYTDATYPITFDYPKGWTIKPGQKITNYYTLNLKSPKNNIITIFISEKDFFAMKDLSTKPYSIGTISGTAWNELIVAVKTGKYYYTFDASQNSSPIIEEFRTILSTVKLQTQ